MPSEARISLPGPQGEVDAAPGSLVRRLVVASIVLGSLLACERPAPTPPPGPSPSATPPACPDQTCPTCRECPSCPTSTSEGPWSTAVQGLRGRFIVHRLPDERGHPQASLDVELESVSPHGGEIPMNWGDANHGLDFHLADAAGHRLDKTGFGGSHFSESADLRFLRGMRVRIPVSRQLYEGAQIIRPVTFQGWMLDGKARGPYSLSATLSAGAGADAGRRAWVGPMDLPPVTLP